MTHPPDLETLVGSDVPAEERERLRRVHELLVAAGPPAELSPELEAGPTLAMTLARRPRRARRRVLLLAAALVLVALAFLGGYLSANRGGGLASGRTLKLAGTSAAPGALAALRLDPVDAAGNWPMVLSAAGLPKLPPRGYYEVFLVRDGRPFAPCGAFVVGKRRAISVHLNAPYHLLPGDSWIVTRQLPGQHEPGAVVLEPTA
jgi:Anti-sigma-K factor rskA